MVLLSCSARFCKAKAAPLYWNVIYPITFSSFWGFVTGGWGCIELRKGFEMDQIESTPRREIHRDHRDQADLGEDNISNQSCTKYTHSLSTEYIPHNRLWARVCKAPKQTPGNLKRHRRIPANLAIKHQHQLEVYLPFNVTPSTSRFSFPSVQQSILKIRPANLACMQILLKPILQPNPPRKSLHQILHTGESSRHLTPATYSLRLKSVHCDVLKPFSWTSLKPTQYSHWYD